MLNNRLDKLLSVFRSLSGKTGKQGRIKLDEEAFDALYKALYGDILTGDPLIDIIKANAGEKSVIYDIGAAHGSYSVYLARKIAGARVYAFEPLPQAYQYMTDYIARFGLKDRITAFNAAVSDTAGECVFYISSDNARRLLSSVQCQGERQPDYAEHQRRLLYH